MPPEAQLAPDRARLAGAAEALGVPLDGAQLSRLIAYRDLLAKWNRVYNLTAVRDPAAMLVQHVVDSLSVVAPLRRHAAGRAMRILDVGSGGGLPGVVVAIVEPAWRVTCVDAVAKKASFIRQAALELGLANLEARHARVEQIGGAFDVIVSRAFATLGDFASLTRASLAPGGVWLAMKGQRPDDEIAALPPDIEVFHVEPLRVPLLDAERCLVWMRHSGPR